MKRLLSLLLVLVLALVVMPVALAADGDPAPAPTLTVTTSDNIDKDGDYTVTITINGDYKFATDADGKVTGLTQPWDPKADTEPVLSADGKTLTIYYGTAGPGKYDYNVTATLTPATGEGENVTVTGKGKMDVADHVHNFTEGESNVTTVDPTCVKKGSKTVTCTEAGCNASVTTEIPTNSDHADTDGDELCDNLKEDGTTECGHKMKDYTVVCANADTEYSSTAYIQLSPTMSPAEPTCGVTYSFTKLSGTASVDSDGTVTAGGVGESVIRVTATWKSGSRTESDDVYVSFYEQADDIEVTLKDSVTRFELEDTGVFSKIVVGNTVSKYDRSLQNLMTGITFSGFTVGVSDSTSYTVGQLADQFEVDDDISCSSGVVGDLVFTAFKKGEYNFTYDLYSSSGNLLKWGYVTINVGDVTAAISYKTTNAKSIQLDEYDFEKYWDANDMASNVSYVTFGEQPSYGDLYTDATEKTLVKISDKFYFSGTTSRLDNVTYKPLSRVASYTVNIPFTIYGSAYSETLNGVVEIKVGQLNPFTDVKASDYFYDAVMWAVEEGITAGTSATTFSPNNVCTRGQVVTFLWRAAGEPTPTTIINPFTDVKKADFYYKAVLWAYEEGITTGITATTFGPNQAITRSQAVTFLYRYHGEPLVLGTNSFADVSTSAFYADAVTWAVKNNITTGMSATQFAPNDGCTRAQIVTFLYRDAK